MREIIALWPSRAELAADMSSQTEPVTLAQVNKWAQRGSIPAAFHARLLRNALRRGFALTATALVEAHDRVTASAGHIAAIAPCNGREDAA